MILAQDVVDKHDRILIVSGMPLKLEIIRLLEKHDITSVFISDPSSVNDQIEMTEDVASAEIRLKLISSVRDAFTNKNGVGEQLAHLQSSVEDVVDTLAKRKNVLLYLNDIDYTSDYLFMHSVNVGLFSIVIGMAMNVPHDELCLLGMGGFLHDFGKTAITPEIINKQGKLTLAEFNEIKEHASLGYRMLKSDDQLDYRIMFMALQHHERCNGSGYPWGIEKDKIHPLARIVAVADVYDALTTDRVYRSRLSSFAAMQIINEGDRIHFDSDVIAAFNKVVIPYHIGSEVILDRGVKGQVVGLNSTNLVRPLISTSEGLLNLLHEPDIKIIAIK
ncbi:HD-GYP domain-containing protein [Pelosinus sp. sgz500959]|uniref:HD-GYP domain-containing protein n=1 Tax=Pelosinus sp. sgz500959 TaxID=3242472 RepID=UPI00366D67BE